MGTVQVAELSRAVRSGDAGAVAEAESRGLELAVGLALPATLGLVVLSDPIVRLLFEHGAFTDADSVATAHVLMVLALALPANVLVKALSPAFFARDDERAPLRATMTGLVVAIVTALLLGHVFGASGVAAGPVIGAWSNAASLMRRGSATFGFSIDAAARRRLPRIVAAALVMGGLLWLVAGALPAFTHGLAQAVALAGLIAAALVVYGVLLGLLGAMSWPDAISAIRQTRSRDLRG
jgi:putative peptidoglycan lipid II flippase